MISLSDAQALIGAAQSTLDPTSVDTLIRLLQAAFIVDTDGMPIDTRDPILVPDDVEVAEANNLRANASLTGMDTFTLDDLLNQWYIQNSSGDIIGKTGYAAPTVTAVLGTNHPLASASSTSSKISTGVMVLGALAVYFLFLRKR